MSSRRISSAMATAALGLTLAFSLSGCFLFPSLDSTSDDSGYSDEPLDGDGTGEDSSEVDTTVVPASFPAEIPLYNGDVAFAVELDAGWSVLLRTSNLNADFDAACTQLAAAGFVNTNYQREGELSSASFTGTMYLIEFTGGENPEHGPVLDYMVTRVP